MRWAEVQDHLATGHLAAREGWRDDCYVELENDDLLGFTPEYPEGFPFQPNHQDLEVDDWFVIGLA